MTDKIRIGDTEREKVLNELGEHFAAGRIDMSEFEQRSSAAGAARFQSELDALLVDLPRKGQLVRKDAVAIWPASQADLVPVSNSRPLVPIALVGVVALAIVILLLLAL
ncbi:MAG: DUF1707 domain-containing protein [Nocardiaceae bacterium]|nr:DUF1707 domain-containing protein [Nocardiaceae bacterium]